MRLEATAKTFRLDGKDILFLSGEIHYFRVPRKLWGLHLARIKQAGCQAVSTYIPWGWHEPEEGKFDLTGKSDPRRDLKGFIQEVHKAGLLLTVKPGPYILAEFVQQGLPGWLLRDHPGMLCRNPRGKVIEEYMVAYMHPTFLDYTARWFDAVLPLLVSRQTDKGGPIAMMQVCNEVGLNQWLSSQADYGKTGIAYWHRFLKERYGKVENLNKLLGTRGKSFKDFSAPSGTAAGPKDYVLYKIWHLYHRWYYALYIGHIIEELRSRGVRGPLYHNVPGWVYARAKDFPQNLSMYEEAVRQHPDLILGVDHIPENPGYRNYHDDLVCNDITRNMRRGRGPLFAAELQAGSREFAVRTYPQELDLFYKACLAHGLTGMNFYMFSQGVNPPRKGHFGPGFYWETALATDGKKLPLYKPIAELGKWAKKHGPRVVRTERRCQIAAGYYAPMYHSEFTHPLWGNTRVDSEACNLVYDPPSVRNLLFFDGVLRGAAYWNIDMETLDIQTQEVKDLLRFKQLWVATVESMDAATQTRLRGYAAGGGHLILLPNAPWLDENRRPCTILEEAIGLKRETRERHSCPKIDMLGHEDLYAFGLIQTFKKKGKVLATTQDGKCCGLQVRLGKGRISVLGTGLDNVVKEHYPAWRTLFGMDDVEPVAWFDEEDVRVVQRFGPGYAYLFLLNYHKVAYRGKVHYTDPKTGSIKVLPAKGTYNLPGSGSMVLPLT